MFVVLCCPDKPISETFQNSQPSLNAMTNHKNTTEFSQEEVAQFQQDGYFVVRNLVPQESISAMKRITQRDLAANQGDIEYEAELSYPGAPQSIDAEGGRTARRLRQAISRDPVFAKLVKEPFLVNRLQQLLGSHIVMPLIHHNCIMTKQPRYSSDTGWHQDTRYWNFTTGDLVNIWIALGDETLQNGCLRVLPGTHHEGASRERLDDALFLRTDLEQNQPLLARVVPVELKAGDVLFFHARCFHAATRNYSTETKQSVVFTFRSLDNPPIPGTKSAQWPELLLS
jgi:phytanoyl-CoA hydroxylase